MNFERLICLVKKHQRTRLMQEVRWTGNYYEVVRQKFYCRRCGRDLK